VKLVSLYDPKFYPRNASLSHGSSSTPGVDFNNWRGDWDHSLTPATVAHEFGHFLRLWDHYFPFSKKPWPGHANDIMADQGGTDVSDKEINSTISGTNDGDRMWNLAGRDCRCKK